MIVLYRSYHTDHCTLYCTQIDLKVVEGRQCVYNIVDAARSRCGPRTPNSSTGSAAGLIASRASRTVSATMAPARTDGLTTPIRSPSGTNSSTNSVLLGSATERRRHCLHWYCCCCYSCWPYRTHLFDIIIVHPSTSLTRGKIQWDWSGFICCSLYILFSSLTNLKKSQIPK